MDASFRYTHPQSAPRTSMDRHHHHHHHHHVLVALQAGFRAKSTVVMAVFFSLTAPVGIALGIAISSVYDDASSTALIVEGVFNAASAGILVYMALVDLLAADFTNPRMQSNGRLQLGAHLALLLGAGLMSLIAIWA